MSKFKICPDCGRCNPPGRIECEECEADLTAVPLTDGEAQENTAHSAAVQPEPPAKPRPVRICACGAENPAAARVCASCGEDISDIIPTAPGEIRCALAACDGSWALALTSTEIILGRERELAEHFAAKPFVSRVHAKLSISGGFSIGLGVGWRVSVFFMSTLCPQDHVSYGWQVSVMIMYAKGGKNEPVFIR